MLNARAGLGGGGQWIIVSIVKGKPAGLNTSYNYNSDTPQQIIWRISKIDQQIVHYFHQNIWVPLSPDLHWLRLIRTFCGPGGGLKKENSYKLGFCVECVGCSPKNLFRHYKSC